MQGWMNEYMDENVCGVNVNDILDFLMNFGKNYFIERNKSES